MNDYLVYTLSLLQIWIIASLKILFHFQKILAIPDDQSIPEGFSTIISYLHKTQ